MTAGIYSISNSVNGQMYIGSALDIGKRWAVHRSVLANRKHHSQKLQRAWDKYGARQFSFETIIECSISDLIFYEQLLIDGFDTFRTGYNCNPSAANSTGRKHCPEALKKISAASIGRLNQYARGAKMSDATKAKIAIANSGKKRTESVVNQLRIARLGNQNSKGKNHSEESKRRMSIARKGRGPSKEHMEMLRLMRIGSVHSAATKQKIGVGVSKASTGKPRGPYKTKAIKLHKKGEQR